MQLMQRLLVEEDGQDVIEYALLTSFIGFTMVGATTWLRTAMQTSYTSWDTTYQSDVLVEVPDPK